MPKKVTIINMTHTVTSSSAEQTLALSRNIGKRLRGGEVIELISDIGGGKTTFVRGLAKGAGSIDHVTSPTFKISNVYKVNRDRPNLAANSAVREIVHMDFYRMDNADLIEHELAEVIDDEHTVVVVEWSELVAHVLPAKRLQVHIKTTGPQSRLFEFEYPKSLAYMVGNP